MNKAIRTCLLTTPLLLAACATLPEGPSVLSLPGTGKSFEAFRADDAECRQYAASSIGGSSASDAQANSAVKSAAVGTAVGALAGAVVGGHRGAGAGAGMGLLVGALGGSAAGDMSGRTLQQRYDNAYVQCMYAKGDRVPAAGYTRNTERRAYAPAAAAPGVNYPPPPPGYEQAPPPPR